MDLNYIYLREVPYRHWNNLRVTNRVKPQNRFNYTNERIGYGLIVDPLEYKDFVGVFEDLSTEDDWLSEFGLRIGENKENYFGSFLHSIIDGRYPEKRKNLLEHLEQADQVSLGLKPKQGKTVEHLYFRKNCSCVYSGSIRVKPSQLDNFQHWGFHDPRIIFIKSDFFPVQNLRREARLNAQLMVRR